MIDRLILSLENTPISLGKWFAGFLGVVWVRLFLESFSNPDTTAAYLNSSLPSVLHLVVFYFAGLLLLVYATCVVTKVPPLSLMRISIFFSPLIWIAPLIDMIQGGARMAYLFIPVNEMIPYFFTFFGPLNSSGITLGIRIELLILIAVIGIYVHSKTKSVSKALIGCITAYGVIFVSSMLPSLLAPTGTSNLVWGKDGILKQSLIAHDYFHPWYMLYQTFGLYFDVAMAQTWFVIVCVVGILWFYLALRSEARAFVKNIRPERLAHYLIAALVGGLIALSSGATIAWTSLDFITIATAVFTITSAWLFAIITNDIIDEPIDAISNRARPLIAGTLSHDLMKKAGNICLTLAIIGALALGSYATFWIVVSVAASYIYSVPPLRLKRIPILSSALIAVATLSMVMLGFFLISRNGFFATFPAQIAGLIFIFVLLIANVRDIKDREGDSAGGIRTLPTLLGEERARMLIGGLTFIACLLVPLFIPLSSLWVPSLLAGFISWVAIVRAVPERTLFYMYFVYIGVVVLCLYFA